MYSFHDAQNMLFAYRAERIKQYKLVFPQLTTKRNSDSQHGTQAGATSNSLAVTEKTNKEDSIVLRKSPVRKSRVGESVAPTTMFQKMKGNTNPDLIAQVRDRRLIFTQSSDNVFFIVKTGKYLSKHAFKITDIDAPSSVAMTSNVRLLREVPPYCKDPYQGKNKREAWDQTATMQGVGLGSMVLSAASSSTWKRKVTSY